MPPQTIRSFRENSAAAEIRKLEEHLEELRKHRFLKNTALHKHNEKMIARDAERHERFLLDFKTPEQLAEEQRQQRLRELEAKLDDLVAAEDDARELLEVEEQLENRIQMQEHHLKLICLTLAVVHSEYDRRENQRKLLIEECNRKAKSYDKLLDTLKSEEFTARKGQEKTESNAFTENITDKWKHEMHLIASVAAAKLKELVVEQAQAELRLQEVETNKLQQDLDRAEEEMLAKMDSITAKYAAMGSLPATRVPAAPCAIPQPARLEG